MSVPLPYVGWTMFKRTVISAISAVSMYWGAAAPAFAEGLGRLDDVVRVTLLEGWREQAGGHYAGIRIDLADGWKTYWRAPGDGGIPTSISWDGSQNLRDVRMFWPRPTVFRLFGMRSVGYTQQVVIPLHLIPTQEGPIEARLALRMGVCKEVCLPINLALTAQLKDRSSAGVAQIRAALADRPKVLDAGLTCSVSRATEGLQLDFAVTLPELPGKKETAVIEMSDPAIWVSEPTFRRQGTKVNGSVRLIAQQGATELDLGSVRMTVLTTRAAVEVKGCKG